MRMLAAAHADRHLIPTRACTPVVFLHAASMPPAAATCRTGFACPLPLKPAAVDDQRSVAAATRPPRLRRSSFSSQTRSSTTTRSSNSIDTPSSGARAPSHAGNGLCLSEVLAPQAAAPHRPAIPELPCHRRYLTPPSRRTTPRSPAIAVDSASLCRATAIYPVTPLFRRSLPLPPPELIDPTVIYRPPSTPPRCLPRGPTATGSAASASRPSAQLTRHVLAVAGSPS
jgi:hypothetical protein